jgi:negative regulator of flagellin synthesis FlgM
MKGITGNPALDAYQRFAVKSVSSAQRTEGASGTAPRPQATEAAKVSISSEARELAAGNGQVNTQKVERLRAAIAEGSYRVDSSIVAQRMLDGVGHQ